MPQEPVVRMLRSILNLRSINGQRADGSTGLAGWITDEPATGTEIGSALGGKFGTASVGGAVVASIELPG